MGRHAGFLTAAGAAWRRDESDGPHLVYVPERTFDTDKFVEDIARIRDRYGRCTVAISEGIHGADGKSVVERLLGDRVERDAHGNVRLGGSDLGVAVQAALNDAFPKVRSRVDTFGYLPRGFISLASDVDRREAFDAGALAIAECVNGSASVALKFEHGKTVLRTVPLEAVAAKTRLMPSEFLTAEGTTLTPAGLSYFNRLIPKAPETFPPLL
jgi:6-phosphofructokinase 1